MRQPLRGFLLLATIILAAGGVASQEEKTRPVKVVFKEGKDEGAVVEAPIDPAVRIVVGYTAGMNFGLQVDGKRIVFNQNGSIWNTVKIDQNAVVQLGQNPNGGIIPNLNPTPLPPGPGGKPREGTTLSWSFQNLAFTREIEVVPSRLPDTAKADANAKRKLDTVRVVYTIENKDTREHSLEFRTAMDILIVNNDGALFAAPTRPGEVLNGVELSGKTMPDYLQVMENPNLQNPGFVAYMTFKMGERGEGPNRVVVTNLGTLSNGNNWDVTAAPGGDTACAFFWPAKNLKSGEKRVMAWAYGGGIASDLDHEGKISLTFGGSFEPGKEFSLTAFVQDPLESQTLDLQLPDGMKLLEGTPRQPVPTPPANTNTSVILWKARVERLGDFPIRVHSSNGTTQLRTVNISRD